VSIEPELACAAASGVSETCNCGVQLTVTNACTPSLEALNFVFDSCGPHPSAPLSPDAGAAAADCASLAPSAQGHLKVTARELGHNERTFTLRHAGQDHVVTVSVEVSSFIDDAFCSVGQGPSRGGAPAFAALACAGFVTLLVRRTRRGRGRVTRLCTPTKSHPNLLG
jgi:hypothetical protein